MAYWLDSSQSYAGSPVQRDFWCDTDSDIQNLPTSAHEGVQQGEDTVSCQKCEKGSTCFCISPTKLYILNSQDEWVEAKKGG
jgi:hypothetical protein